MRARIAAFPNPHPALFLTLRPVGLALRGATLSRWERDTPLHDSHDKIPATQAFEPTGGNLDNS